MERFLKYSSIEFTKKNQSVTYLVFSVADGKLLGYFTLALKPLTVRGETVSNTVKRKLLRVSELDKKSDTYTIMRNWKHGFIFRRKRQDGRAVA